jgi:hypothetical protein
MNDLIAVGGEFRATVQIIRKATGKVEVVELIGKTTPEQHNEIMEKTHGSNPQHRG